MSHRTLALERPLDLVATLRPLYRGLGDPTMRLGPGGVERASETAAGPAAIAVTMEGETVRAEAWGPGGDVLLETLPGFLGLDDGDATFDPSLHPVIADLARRRRGLRLGRTGAVFDALVPAILEQKITGGEAFRAYRRLVSRHGTAAPGPSGLRVPPSAKAVAALPSFAFPPLGIEPRRGALLRRVASDASRLEAAAAQARGPNGGGAGSFELAARLRRYSGIGPWTAAEVTLRALGDPDAVSIGDAHTPNVVAWALAREPRGTDERMLELLAPWAGHRARVIRLLELARFVPPRYGPRVAPRDLRDLIPRD